MGYSVKWVEEHLGITRKALRYYEHENLLSTEHSRNPTNQYRDYTDDDLNKIWSIKLLIKIGYTAKEVYAIMHDPNFDFYTSISQKVAELEKKHDETVIYLEFAKSIKFSGKIPTATKLGNIKFDDFISYCYDNWNFYNDPRTAPFMKLSDALINKAPREWESKDLEQLESFFENIDVDMMKFAFSLHGYYQVIVDMHDLGYKSEIVQRVVGLMHEHFIKNNKVPELDGKITPQYLAKYIAISFCEGDTAILNERNYGKEGCKFIANALAYYGGFNSIKEIV